MSTRKEQMDQAEEVEGMKDTRRQGGGRGDIRQDTVRQTNKNSIKKKSKESRRRKNNASTRPKRRTIKKNPPGEQKREIQKDQNKIPYFNHQFDLFLTVSEFCCIWKKFFTIVLKMIQAGHSS